MHKRRVVAIALAAALLLAAVSAVGFVQCVPKHSARETVRIAIPYSKYVYQPNTNYYTHWLEEQTGLDIEFVLMEEPLTDEYLRLLFSTNAGSLDAMFLAPGKDDTPLNFHMQGLVLPLEEYIDAMGENTKAMFHSFDAYNLRAALTAEDGHIYWLPNVSAAQHTQTAQTMWINVGWLQKLGLHLPQTTEEFTQVVRAFANEDPNGNGMADEVAIAGCVGADAYRPYHFLINAFVYNDPRVAHLSVEDGQVSFAPASNDWREALIYLHELYSEELLPPESFSFTSQQLEQLVNDPRDLVGCFTSESISDVVRTHSPDVLSRFVHLPPLQGPSGAAFAQAPTPQVAPGGLIFAQCQNPEAVFRLMDLMLSPDAALIAHFGQQDENWNYAAPGDVSISGKQALIHVRTNLAAGLHNQNLAQAGPCYLAAGAADGVMWGGPLMEQMFADGRAAMAYRGSYPEESIPALLFPPEQQEELLEITQQLADYTALALEDFVVGRVDITDDDAWERYVQKFDTLGLRQILVACQSLVDSDGKAGAA